MNSLRVIAGKVKGRKLFSVPGDSTRPITDRTKESLFNIIGGDIQDAKILDLFAGTGSVGIEALSRGAKFSRFLDINRQAIETIQRNLEVTGFSKNAEIIRTNAIEYISRKPDARFEYVYVAPPQYKNIWENTLLILDRQSDWLTDDGWVIAQIHPIEYKSLDLRCLIEFDQRRYGSTLLVFYEILPTISTNNISGE